MDTPAAGVYAYLAQISGPNGPQIVNQPGSGAPYVPPQASPPGFLTPGDAGKSAAVIPTSGAVPLAGAPGTSGTATITMPTGSDVGTENIGAPAQPDPTYVPNPNTVDEAGGYRFGLPVEPVMPRLPNTPEMSLPRGAMILAAMVGLYLITKQKG